MKMFIPFITLFLLMFAACEYTDQDKNCSEIFSLQVAACQTLPEDDREDCLYYAGGFLATCDPESYWKSWGCEDGQPCM